MSKTKLIACLTTACSLLTGISLFFNSSKDIFTIAKGGPIDRPGEITISANNSTTVMSGSGNATYISALGNDFTFSYQNVSRSSGSTKYYTALEIANITPLNGIYELDIYSAESTILINNNEYNLANGLNTLSIIDSGVSYITIKGNGNATYMFTYLTIRYTCSSDIQKQKIDYFKINKYNDILIDSSSNNSVYFNCIAAEFGTKLNDVKFDIEVYVGEEHFNVTSDSNHLIRYIENDSNTVLYSNREISLSFIHNNKYYYLPGGAALFGYRNCAVSFHTQSYQTDWPIQDNDNVPNDYIINGYGAIYFSYSYSSSFYWVIYSDTYTIVNNKRRDYLVLTDEMIVEKDEHAFSEIGDHSLTFSYYGDLVNINYCVYDPDYCMIKRIYPDDEGLAVPFGCSTSYFYDYIVTKQINADYFGGGTGTITLDSSNFYIDDSAFISPYDNVYVPFRYQNYNGRLEVGLNRTPGNIVNTYINDEGVQVFYENEKATKIVLYDNGLACVFTGENYETSFFDYIDSNTPQGSMYFVENNVVTIQYHYYTFRFVLDDINHTFTQYGVGATFIEMDCDFSAVGLCSELLVGRYYIFNYYIEYDYQGITYYVEFTHDIEDESDFVVYFVLPGTGIDCIGRIEITSDSYPAALLMTVTPVE